MGILSTTRAPLLDCSDNSLNIVAAPGESEIRVMFSDGNAYEIPAGPVDAEYVFGESFKFYYVYALYGLDGAVIRWVAPLTPDWYFENTAPDHPIRYLGCVYASEQESANWFEGIQHSTGGAYSSVMNRITVLNCPSFDGKTSGVWYTYDVTDKVPLTASALQLSFKLSTWSEFIAHPGESWTPAPWLDMAVSMVGASPYSNAFSSTSAEPFRVLTVSGYNTGTDQGTVVSRTNLWLPVQDVGGQRILALMGNWSPEWPDLTSMEVFLLGFIEDSKYTDP